MLITDLLETDVASLYIWLSPGVQRVESSACLSIAGSISKWSLSPEHIPSKRLPSPVLNCLQQLCWSFPSQALLKAVDSRSSGKPADSLPSWPWQLLLIREWIFPFPAAEMLLLPPPPTPGPSSHPGFCSWEGRRWGSRHHRRQCGRRGES